MNTSSKGFQNCLLNANFKDESDTDRIDRLNTLNFRSSGVKDLVHLFREQQSNLSTDTVKTTKSETQYLNSGNSW